MRLTLTLTCVALVLATVAAQARIMLTTLPERESVRIDIQNGRYTLVEEERTVNLQAGDNQVNFGWAVIGIDKDSIVFRVIKADGAVNVLNTNYPMNENAIYWDVSAEKAGPATIRISYLIGNMAAEPSYQGIVDTDEKHMLLQVYSTITNTSGEDFGACTVQPGLGKATVRDFQNGERKRMLAATLPNVPITKHYIFDPLVDQARTRMYYEIINDTAHGMGQFALPYGKARLYIQESGVAGAGPAADATSSQAFLGEDWAAYTPLFGTLNLYIGVAQDVKVERFIMPPTDGGPGGAYDEVTCKRVTEDGKTSVTSPLFRNERTTMRYRLQNFKTENGKAVTVPLTIKEKVDGEWTIEKVELQEVTGERDLQKTKVIPYTDIFSYERIDVNNVEYKMNVPPTAIDKKYDLFVTVLRKNRPYQPEPVSVF
jgi:hypothetical protein